MTMRMEVSHKLLRRHDASDTATERTKVRGAETEGLQTPVGVQRLPLGHQCSTTTVLIH